MASVKVEKMWKEMAGDPNRTPIRRDKTALFQSLSIPKTHLLIYTRSKSPAWHLLYPELCELGDQPASQQASQLRRMGVDPKIAVKKQPQKWPKKMAKSTIIKNKKKHATIYLSAAMYYTRKVSESPPKCFRVNWVYFWGGGEIFWWKIYLNACERIIFFNIPHLPPPYFHHQSRKKNLIRITPKWNLL